MKKSKTAISLVLVLVSVGVLAFAAIRNYPTEPARFEVGVSSLMIMAPRGVTARDWVAGTAYSHGDMVRNSSSRKLIYWNVSGVTNQQVTETEPSHKKGDATDGGTNIWRRIPPEYRDGYTVQNTGTGSVWLAMNYNAVTNRGMNLLAGGSHFVDNDSYQGSLYAISIDTAGGQTNTVTTQEY